MADGEQQAATVEAPAEGAAADWDALFAAEFGGLSELDAAAAAGELESQLNQLEQAGGALQGQDGMHGGPEAGPSAPDLHPGQMVLEPETRYMDEDEGDDGGLPGDEIGAPDQTADSVGGEQGDAGPAGPGVSQRDQEVEARNARIIASMTDAQLERYAAYRRSALPRSKMKKLLQQLIGVVVTDRTLVAMCGVGKMFVGDLVELARHLANGEGYVGPLLPRHIQRAFQVLDAAEQVPHPSGTKKRLFR